MKITQNHQTSAENIEPLSSEQICALHSQIASNVAKIRKAKGYSQLELSLAIGYKSVSLISGAEAGYKNIHFNLEQLYRIANALQVPIKEFFEGVDEIRRDTASLQ